MSIKTLCKYLVEVFSAREQAKVLCVFKLVKGRQKLPHTVIIIILQQY